MKKIFIMPTFNPRDVIYKFINQFITFNKGDSLLLIINDGTTSKDSIKILRDLKNKKLKDVIIINKINGGKHTALNSGLDYINLNSLAQIGDAIIFIDDDMYFKNKKLEDQFFNSIIENQEKVTGLSFIIQIKKNEKNINKKSEILKSKNLYKYTKNKEQVEVFFLNEKTINLTFRYPEFDGEKMMVEYHSTYFTKRNDLIFLHKDITFDTLYGEDGYSVNFVKNLLNYQRNTSSWLENHFMVKFYKINSSALKHLVIYFMLKKENKKFNKSLYSRLLILIFGIPALLIAKWQIRNIERTTVEKLKKIKENNQDKEI